MRGVGSAPGPGVALVACGCFYPGGRFWYEPDPAGTWRWSGDPL
ncbi:hypothetical protein [Kitasatospora sp. GP82]|nr:hypothetical protein [Kitasatospora sp. GP82]MDH6129884.1 hypothetical protein [Kitasatospora sp. GP82]